jgi:hypothetical protein
MVHIFLMACTKFNEERKENRKRKRRGGQLQTIIGNTTSPRVKEGVVELQTSQQKIKESFFEAQSFFFSKR